MNKSITVAVERMKLIAKFHKRVKVVKKYICHDEKVGLFIFYFYINNLFKF